MDQAVTLRAMAEKGALMEDAVSTRVIAVSSGKGGVGKTNSVVNLAVAFSRMGKRVLLLDADMGLGNLDVLLGLAPEYNMGRLLRGEKTMDEVIVRGPAGIMIPASSGAGAHESLFRGEVFIVVPLREPPARDRHHDNRHRRGDIEQRPLLQHGGSGDSRRRHPEPTSITDAYALMKVLLRKHGERRFKPS